MAKREFLQLAHPYNPSKHGIAGWFASEKLDGMRALWDGGCSRGVPCLQVPWANTEKHDRFVVQPISTGLWTRYGQPIHAPAWFLDALPPCILDGELYAGRGFFQHVVSATKKHQPIDSEWQSVRYNAFDCPRADQVFADGTINNTNFKKTFKGILGAGILGNILEQPPAGSPFQSRLKFLAAVELRYANHQAWRVHEQKQMPLNMHAATGFVEGMLEGILAQGGEGLILKSPSNIWSPERSHQMVKVKNCQDAEGTVIGYVWGKKTDLGSKLLGLMGGLVLRQDNGKELEISGFTDEERRMTYMDGYGHDGTPANLAGGQDAKAMGELFPGRPVASWVHNPKFPRGTRITYKFRELTDDGVAKEARYHRIRTDA